MAKYRNISGVDIRGPFIPGEYAEPGEVVDLPMEQVIEHPDGTVEKLPLIHPPDIWEPVDRKAKAVEKAAEKAADKAAAEADEEVVN